MPATISRGETEPAPLVGRRLALRLAAMGVLLTLYYAFEWVTLRLGLRSALMPVLDLLGRPSVALDAGSELFVVLEGRHRFAIGPNCTYADLVLITAPFVWRFRRPLAVNLRRLAALTVLVLALNVVRVALALDLYSGGVPWLLAHTVPDLTIHGATVAVLALLALRADRIDTPDTVRSAEAS